jgi:ribosome-binding ATPase YchF (GTP1/OBG family)
VTGAEELIDAGSYAVLRERGKQRLEGRDYVMRDGDIIHIRFKI